MELKDRIIVSIWDILFEYKDDKSSCRVMQYSMLKDHHIFFKFLK